MKMELKSLVLIIVALCGTQAAREREPTCADNHSLLTALGRMTKGISDKLDGHDISLRASFSDFKTSFLGVDRRLNRVDDRLLRLEDKMNQMNDVLSSTLVESVANLKSTVREIAFRNEGLSAPCNDSSNAARADDLQKLFEVTYRLENRLEQRQRTPTAATGDMGALIAALPNKELFEGVLAQTERARVDIMEAVQRVAEEVQIQKAIQEDVAKTSNALAADFGNSFSETRELMLNITGSSNVVLKAMQPLSNLQAILLETGENVLDAKRRMEYGVHQILQEVGGLVRQQTSDLNETLNSRFGAISGAILSHQAENLGNISSKIDTQISQVWRQISIMHTQLTDSAGTLDRLQQQTATYVNGSMETMDSMQGKVSTITSRMSEVDGNLNYLLGKLSLVTQEFNQIKSGLASALDDIRKSFLEVQGQVKDLGPGPNPIPDEPQTPPILPPTRETPAEVDNHV